MMKRSRTSEEFESEMGPPQVVSVMKSFQAEMMRRLDPRHDDSVDVIRDQVWICTDK